MVDHESVVADTHAWIWHVSDPAALSGPAARALADAGEIGLSPMSIWEIALKHRDGKLPLGLDLREWLRLALGYPRIHVLGMSPEMAIRAVDLRDEGIRDPADAFIAATASVLRRPLVTKDEKLRSLPGLQVIW